MRKFALLLATLAVSVGGVCPSVAGEAKKGQTQTLEAQSPQGVWPRERLGRTPSIKPSKWGSRWNNDYGNRVEHCALTSEELTKIIGKVVKGHPRLLLRPKPWKGGLSVAQFRERVKKQPWAEGFQRMAKVVKGDVKKAIENKTLLRRGYLSRTALYYLATRDESVIPLLVARVLSDIPRYNCGGGLMTTCRVYDWICNSPSLTEAQKQKMRDHIAATAFKCAKVQESGHAFCSFHHRGGCGWMADVLVAGLVLRGEHPDAEKLLRLGVGYFMKNYFRGWQRLGGRWSDYHVASNQMPMAIALWASAVAEPNVYEVIKRDYGDWLQGLMYHMMAVRLPSKTFSGPSAGGEHDQSKWLMSHDNYMLISRGYKNPDGYAYLRWMGHEPKRLKRYGSQLNVLLYDEATDAGKPSFKENRPFTWMWGRDGNGYVVMRSKGWAPDSTVVEFRCGDYFWSHALGCNNNSFYIYHKGHLASHSGLYGGIWRGRGHSAEYSWRTVASNSMLIYQPGEFWVCRGRNTLPAHGHGGQRWAYPGHSNNFTFDEYLSRLKGKGRYHFETGEIPAFEHAPDRSWSYVCGDATDAYNNPKYCDQYKGRKNKPKIDLFTRSMVYLPKAGNLIVFDRVNALDPSYRKAWLLHSVGKPQISGEIIKTQVPGHIEDFDGDTAKITWEGGVIPPPDPKDPGRLFVKTFLPKQHYTRRIGGKGYEFWVDGKNRVPGAYRGCIVPGTRHPIEAGRWRIEVSPTKPSKFDNFLHLIHICDTKTKKMPPAEMVTAKDEKMIGLVADGWLVMFGKRGTVAGEVSYKAPAGKTEHLVVDLKRGAKYRVAGITDGEKGLTASKEGTLRFATDKADAVTLTPEK